MLRLRRDLLDAMVAHCRAEHPIEACGVLAGRDGVAERHIPMVNAAESRTRYALDPDEQLAAWRDMDDHGEQAVVIYHSHTATAAVPSAPDVAYAAEPDAHYVIVSTRANEHEVRSYRIADGEAAEEPVEVIDPDRPTTFERLTKSFRVVRRDGTLWVEDIDGGQDDAWLLVPDDELDSLIAALQDAQLPECRNLRG